MQGIFTKPFRRTLQVRSLVAKNYHKMNRIPHYLTLNHPARAAMRTIWWHLFRRFLSFGTFVGLGSNDIATLCCLSERIVNHMGNSITFYQQLTLSLNRVTGEANGSCYRWLLQKKTPYVNGPSNAIDPIWHAPPSAVLLVP